MINFDFTKLVKRTICYGLRQECSIWYDTTLHDMKFIISWVNKKFKEDMINFNFTKLVKQTLCYGLMVYIILIQTRVFDIWYDTTLHKKSRQKHCSGHGLN
jgi:hypothetical protein